VAFSVKIYCKFTVEYACKKFKTKKSQHLAKLQARKLIVSRILGTVLLKDEEPDILIMAVTLILTWLR